MKTKETIRAVFNRANEAKYTKTIARDSFTQTALAALYTLLEEHRLPVSVVFLPSAIVPNLNYVLGKELRPKEGALEGVEGFRYLGCFWDADFYECDALPSKEVIAVTVPELLRESEPEHSITKHGVVKLIIGERPTELQLLLNW